MLASPKRSALLSGLLHCGAILLILAATRVKPQLITKLRDVLWIPRDIESYKLTSQSAGTGGGGGGGGAHAKTPASIGAAPRFAYVQKLYPSVNTPDHEPILPLEPTIIGDPDIKLASLDMTR